MTLCELLTGVMEPKERVGKNSRGRKPSSKWESKAGLYRKPSGCYSGERGEGGAGGKVKLRRRELHQNKGPLKNLSIM